MIRIVKRVFERDFTLAYSPEKELRETMFWKEAVLCYREGKAAQPTVVGCSGQLDPAGAPCTPALLGQT